MCGMWLRVVGSFVLCWCTVSEAAALEKGYKGVAWGTPCGEALEALEKKGIEFDTFWKNKALAGGGGDSHFAFGASEAVPGARCGLSAVLEQAFQSDYPYAMVEGSAGAVSATAVCRGGVFVGMLFKADMDYEKKGLGFLRGAAGPAVASRNVVISAGDWRHVIQVGTLSARGDAARYTVVDATPDSQEKRSYEYVVMSKSESDAIRIAQSKCTRAEAEQQRNREAEEKKRARSAIQ